MTIEEQQAEVRALGAELRCTCQSCPECKSTGPGGVQRTPRHCTCWGQGYSAGTRHWNKYPDVMALIAQYTRSPEPGIYGSKERKETE